MNTSRPLALLALVLVALSAQAQAARVDSVHLFALERAASGGAAHERLGEIIESGRIVGQGQNAPYTTYIEPRSGYSKTITVLSTGPSPQGYDAEGAWSQNNGVVEIYDGPSNLRAQRAQTYVARNGWWHPQADPASFTYLRRAGANGRFYDVVRVVPQGGDSLEVWLDTRTHLIYRLAETDNLNQVTTTTYGDYRRVGAIVYPFASLASQGAAQYDQRTTVSSVHLLSVVRPSDISRPPSRRSGSIASGSATTLPFDVDAPQGGHIIIVGRIDGSRPLHLIFDTGGANSLTPEVARELGLHGQGNLPIGDAGGSQVSAQLANVKALSLGGATLHNQSFAIIAMPPSIVAETGRYHIDGLVGAEVLDNFVVSIDHEKRQMTLIDPRAFAPAGHGARVPFRSDGTPLVSARLNGIGGNFIVDTGNPWYNSLTGPFVQTHNLETAFAHSIPIRYGALKSALSGQLVRVKALEIGPYTVKDVPFALTDTASGSLADHSMAGNLSETVLAQFDVTLDYAHRSIYFRPNHFFNRWVSGNRSGLWTSTPRPGALLVTLVVPDSPAAEAGMRRGDVIIAVDGQPARRSLLSERAERRNLTLTFERGGKSQTRTLVTRELLP